MKILRPILAILVGSSLFGCKGVEIRDPGFNSISTVLLYPNGGQRLAGGSTINITWFNDKFTASNLQLRYSTDSGMSWTSISSNAPDTGSYAWTVPAIDSTHVRVQIVAAGSGNRLVSDFSASDFTIDSTAPSAPTGLGWVQASPQATLNVTASWTKSASSDLANQKIQFYSDGTCTTASGALIDLASATIQTRAFSAPADGTYSYNITSADDLGNSGVSGCSSAMVINTIVPILAWSPQTYDFGIVNIGVNSATQIFTLSNSGPVSATGCSAPSLSNSADFSIVTDICATNNLGGSGSCTVTIRANPTSTGTRTTTLSRNCTVGGTASTTSNGIVVFGGIALGIHPKQLIAPIGLALNQTFAATGGSGTGYTYSIVSGPGAINSSSGLYTSAIGERNANETTTIQVMDSLGFTATATIKHGRRLTNGPVYASVSDATSLYIGGRFGMLYPNPAIGFMAADTTTGNLVTPDLALGFSSSTTASINAMIISGTTAYLGGTFSSYRGLPVQNLVKIDLTTGALDTNFTLSVGPSSTVNALVLSGGSLYVAGNFTSYRGDNRGYRLIKIDATSGALDTTFNSTASAGPNNTVQCMVMSGGAIYIGGDFGAYRGDSKATRLAKIDAATGALDTVNFNLVSGSGPDSTVSALVVSGSALFLGGNFTSYRGDNRGYRLAKVDLTTGALETAAFNTTASSGPDNTVSALAISGTSLFVGGGFSNYRGDSRGQYLAKVDTTTGALETASFNTAMSWLGGSISSLAIDGGSLYVGGGFLSFRGDTRAYQLAKLDVTTAALETTNFNTTGTSGPSSSPMVMAVSGSTLYLGGGFTSYRGAVPAQNLAKVDIASGAIDTAFTQSTGPNNDVYALALSGSSLYVGGVFTTYRGDNKGNRLAKVDTTTGTMDTVNFNTTVSGSGIIRSLALSGSALYVGGVFTAYRGDAKGYNLAKVDATTGIMDTANFNTVASSGPDSTVMSIATSGSSVYIGGYFANYRGNANGAYLAKIDATTGALDTANFNSSAGPNNIVNALTISGTDLYFGGSFTTYRGDAKGYYLAKVDASTGALDTANFNTIASSGPNNPVQSLLVTGASLYAGGGFSAYRGDVKGLNLIKVDALTGVLDTVNFNTGAAGASASTLSLFGTSLFAGGSFTSYRGNTTSPNAVIINPTTGAEN